MDIGSGTGYPSANLSNFHPHAFTINGIACASMEGFLQSLKFENPDMQAQVCTLVGKKAKFKGKKKKWWRDQTLYWHGTPMKITQHSPIPSVKIKLPKPCLQDKNFAKDLQK